jgi:hypothetical protein
MKLKSPAFAPGEKVPTRYSADGKRFSPPLEPVVVQPPTAHVPHARGVCARAWRRALFGTAVRLDQNERSSLVVDSPVLEGKSHGFCGTSVTNDGHGRSTGDRRGGEDKWRSLGAKRAAMSMTRHSK